MPFTPSVKHSRNTDKMVQCTVCDKWRLAFAKRKLNKNQKDQLAEWLADVDYTCGLLFGVQFLWFIEYLCSSVCVVERLHFFTFFPGDLNLPPALKVFIKDHDCLDPIEKLYFSCGYEPCCIHCGNYLHGYSEDVDEDVYPQCEECTEPPIKKRNYEISKKFPYYVIYEPLNFLFAISIIQSIDVNKEIVHKYIGY